MVSSGSGTSKLGINWMAISGSGTSKLERHKLDGDFW